VKIPTIPCRRLHGVLRQGEHRSARKTAATISAAPSHPIFRSASGRVFKPECARRPEPDELSRARSYGEPVIRDRHPTMPARATVTTDPIIEA